MDSPSPMAAKLPQGLIASDCRLYKGDKPCALNRTCAGCQQYRPYEQRICILKLGALGDVIRTLCILPELRRQFPQAQITWVSLDNGVRMLAGHPLIDRLMVFNPTTQLILQAERFDTLICLDKEPAPCALAMAIDATRKLGVGLSGAGTPVPLNAEAMDYFLLGLSDELKFRVNTKSYPQLVHEALGLTYQGQRYSLPLDSAVARQVRRKLARLGWDCHRPTVGVNVGAGRVFANKMWPAERIGALLHKLVARRPEVQILLLGGPDEKPIMDQLHAALPQTIHTGTDNPEPEFVALVDACDLLLCGDTMAMHVAVARRRGVVALFGPTCEQEIELYGRGEKVVARVPCGPCYKRTCDQRNACVGAVGYEPVLEAIERVLALMIQTPVHLSYRQAG